jgi:hypothetical protein
MKKLWIAAATILALAALPALASEATFERTLAVNGRVELTVTTGSGNIHLTRGAGNQIHIFGRVKSGWGGNVWGGNDDQVRRIAANPPIAQTGNIVRIGRHENLHNISIDYEIQAPADAFLDASSGSGNVVVDGVGENAKIATGSGNIHATGMHGGFKVDTGSGDIYAEQIGAGDVKAHAGTGSGNIKAGGTPSAEWKLETGSGNVELWAGSAAFTLDASTGSGSIHTDQEMVTQGTQGHHHVTGKLHGGGPTVRIQTGSGDIRVH